ncbi:hypothetical protein [Campylobacter sp. 19-13652]|uniref:hypothetical protein n=1 Tax=Campylobacter sp. 19-13652 TaxID=2840180 RepID=UPI001C74E30F|nr:hypothetical protein [Campylobacter sp. 19-13652]BCX79892.1 hypothetical protein LBC_13540 [Campylobacter sp. 19-13652]
MDYQKTSIPKVGFDPFYSKRINFFKSIIKELDVDPIICTCHEYNFFIAFAAKSLGVKCIISEHGNHLLVRGIKKKILRYFAYKSAAFITLLTKFDMDFFRGA